MWVCLLGLEDPPEEGMATHSNILAWRIPWKEEPGGLQSMGSQRVRHNWEINSFTFHCVYSMEVLSFSTPKKIQAVTFSYLIILAAKDPLKNARLKGSVLKPGCFSPPQDYCKQEGCHGGGEVWLDDSFSFSYPSSSTSITCISNPSSVQDGGQRRDKGKRKVAT